VSHHGQASDCNSEQQHRELWPAYNLNLASPQASTEGLFQQTQAMSQACAFCPPVRWAWWERHKNRPCVSFTAFELRDDYRYVVVLFLRAEAPNPIHDCFQ
jgi:hypothetical protein